jgi:hypothetical protein
MSVHHVHLEYLFTGKFLDEVSNQLGIVSVHGLALHISRENGGLRLVIDLHDSHGTVKLFR